VAEINLSLQPINLERSEYKPIHVSGQIQPHGVLFVLEEPDLKIVQTSTNTYQVFGVAPEKIVEQKLEDIFDSFQVETIKSAVTNNNLDSINPSKLWARIKGDDYVIFDGVFHRNADGCLLLELEPAFSQEIIPFLSFYHLARTSIDRIEETSNLREFCQIIVKEVRKLTGFDRVMLYKFDEENHGDVIAEEKLESLPSYLGLHYPESDIPAPARRLFSSNYIRLIPDARVKPVKLFPINHPTSQQPLDLTLSILRSASPCHLEYLNNMGVGSSLTISLTKEGKLWALIACHHQTPKYVSYELRKACEFLGRVIFSELSAKEETEDYDYRMKLTYVRSTLIDYMSGEENFIDGLVKHKPNLLDLTSSQGAAVCFGDKCIAIGKTPTEENLNYLVQWLQNNVNEEVRLCRFSRLTRTTQSSRQLRTVIGDALSPTTRRRCQRIHWLCSGRS
jgi:two-component system, chemotaxis family, sensor kinase Cph1